MKHFLSYILITALLVAAAVSCRKQYDDVADFSKRKVLIYYAAAYNNLSGNILGDLEELQECLPSSSQGNKYKVIVVSHTPQYNGDYYNPTAPVIYDYYMDGNKVVRDTVHRFDRSSTLIDPQVMKKALSFIKERYPAGEYGLCISSHGSGWLPDEYFTFPEYDREQEVVWNAMMAPANFVMDPILREYMSDNPTVKSAGAHYQYGTSHFLAMNITELAESLPFKLEYILFDMCLMGCVEVAYQLRGNVRYVAFSPMEVMSDGFQYKKILDHLFYGPNTDLVSVCKDTYEYYLTASSPYCTISLVDCSKLEPLAQLCASLVDSHRTAIDTVDSDKVQVFFRAGRHFFYDLKDIFDKAGISADESSALQAALDECVVYKAATKKGTFGYFNIVNYCGMSMCIPHICSDYIKDYYEVYDWNKVTSLVK